MNKYSIIDVSNVSNRVESPCIKICTLDDNDVCLGCFRTVDEIKAWHTADDYTRTQILIASQKRGPDPQQ